MRVTSTIKVGKNWLIFCLLIVFLLIGLSSAIFAEEKTSSSDKIKESSILLEPTYRQLKINDKFKVAVMINTSLPLIGADLKITYDDRVLGVESIDEGEAFSKFPRKQFGKGEINITALADKGKEFSGTGTLATLNLKAKDAGDTKLNIEFKSGKTNDSNLTQVPAADVLTKVDSGYYTIGNSTQRALGAIKRFLIKIIPYALFLALLIIFGYLLYRWYKAKKEGGPDVFIPEEVPLDRPPQV